MSTNEATNAAVSKAEPGAKGLDRALNALGTLMIVLSAVTPASSVFIIVPGVIALAGTITENMKQASIASGIDEVILKPMSPKYLLERVLSRLDCAPPQIKAGRYQGPERRGRLRTSSIAAMAAHARRGDNVVPLFRE